MLSYKPLHQSARNPRNSKGMLSYKPLHQSARHPRNSTGMLSYKPLHQSARNPRNSKGMLSYKPLHQSADIQEILQKCSLTSHCTSLSFHLQKVSLNTIPMFFVSPVPFSLPRDIFVMKLSVRNTVQHFSCLPPQVPPFEQPIITTVSHAISSVSSHITSVSSNFS